MFTGLIEEIGTITALGDGAKSALLEIACAEVLKGIQTGDSICVDGICLTATEISSEGFSAFVSAETFRKTSLAQKQAGSTVNLERALTLEKRLGGHLVQGHVDGTADIECILPEGESQLWSFKISVELSKFMAPKGSVTVDGVSLTIVDVSAGRFSVALIPKTLSATTLGQRKAGDLINIETDIIGKYVYRFLQPNGL